MAKPIPSVNYSAIICVLVVLGVSLYLSSVVITRPKQITSTETQVETVAMTTTAAATEVFGVKIEKNPPQSKLDDLGVSTWKKWGSEPTKIPWTFEATETMYLLEGKVKVSVDGCEGSFEIGTGDLVVFPKGMKITWDVLEAVNKHYSLEK